MNLLFYFLVFGGSIVWIPIIATGISVYCWFRYRQNGSYIALAGGILSGLIAIGFFVGLMLDK